MSLLADLTESLRNAVAVPGTFLQIFPETVDSDLEAVLLDAFAEAQLDGFLSTVEVTDLGETTPDLTRAQQALVVIYAGYRILVNEVRQRNTRTRYKAGPAESETEQTASMLNEILRQLKDRKDKLIERAERGEFDDSGVFTADLAYIKATADYGWNSELSLYEYQGLV